jgi:hypothetical protein
MIKRYQQFFDVDSIRFLGPTHNMFEMVQRPENYYTIIKEKIEVFRNRNIFESLDDLIISLNSYFIDEKIIFISSKTKMKFDSGLTSAGYNPKTNELYLFYNSDISNAFKMENKEQDIYDYKWFLEDLEGFIGHEIIHRMQYFKDKIKDVGVMSKENRKKYLAKPKEIMAYAWQIVQTFKLNGKDDDFIKFVLGSKRDLENVKIINFIPMLAEYYNTFDKDSNTMKLLYKYIYQYVDK